MTRIVILGAGTGGTLVANRLRRRCRADVDIVVIDRDDRHLYQPGLLFVPFGTAEVRSITRSRAAQLRPGIRFMIAEIDRVDVAGQAVHLESGESLSYDVLVVASGARLAPEETEGLRGTAHAHDFYTPAGATALRRALAGFDRGSLVVNPVDMPIKCPVAPLEFCFLADWELRRRGVRDAVELVYVTPLDAAFTKPVAAAHLAGMLDERNIRLESEFATGRVEPGTLVSWDERRVAFDLLVAIPAHCGAAFVERSPGLGDELGFVECDPHTLQAAAAPNVFAIGDATNLPTSKAGSVTHFEGETLVENVTRHLAGEPLVPGFDGHANCFVETGYDKALLIDFNSDVEPLPGRFPFPRTGPLPLLKPSRLNHLAKLAFQPIYWHVLLRGHEIPGIPSRMRVPEGASR